MKSFLLLAAVVLLLLLAGLFFLSEDRPQPPISRTSDPGKVGLVSAVTSGLHTIQHAAGEGR